MPKTSKSADRADGEVITWRDLTPLMRPRTVAIVGASQRPPRGNTQREARATRLMRNLLKLGFSGQVFPVNPKYEEVLGIPCYPALDALPQSPECIVAAIPASHVPGLLKSAVDLGARSAVVLSSGFGEAGANGKKRQAELEALSKEHDLLICGPNCYGLFNVVDKIALFTSPVQPEFPSGEVAIVSQSGGMSTAVADALIHNHGVGLSYLVSCGNQAGATVEEYLNYFVDDPHTKVMVAFVEGIKQPRKLLAVGRKALTQNKPIILLKVGRSEASQRATATHTGSLAGGADVAEAAFRRSGIVEVHSLNEMIDTAALFSCPSFGILSGSGGECSLVADVIQEAGLELPDFTEATKARFLDVMPDFGTPQNPLDATGAMYETEDLFGDLLGGLVTDSNLDCIAIKVTANEPRSTGGGAGNRRFALAIADIARSCEKPIVGYSSIIGGAIDQETVLPLREAGVPFLEGTELAIGALRNLAQYHMFRKSAVEGTSAAEPILPSRPLGYPAGILPTAAAFRLMESFGIPVVPSALAGSEDEAVAAAERLGFPVVLKVESASIQHKSDIGGVVLDCTTATAVREAYRRVLEQVTARLPESSGIEGVLVQRMAPGGVETILGIKRDPVFGPVVVFGLGGVYVELLRDVVVELPPIRAERAHDLLQRLRGWPLLAGMRGQPPADIGALSDAIAKVSHLALAHRDRMVALDINPLIVHPEGQGVHAVDVVVQVDGERTP
jgi:acetate---CoA ligase (ADP-forming)